LASGTSITTAKNYRIMLMMPETMNEETFLKLMTLTITIKGNHPLK